MAKIDAILEDYINGEIGEHKALMYIARVSGTYGLIEAGAALE